MQIKHQFVLIHISNNGEVGLADKKTQENITHRRAKRSALSQLSITRLHVADLLRQHNKDKHET